MIIRFQIFALIVLIGLMLGCIGTRDTDAQAIETPTMPRRVVAEGVYNVPDNSTLKDRLTPLQYNVTQEEGTEPPFRNLYWDNHAAGIYVDIVSGEPLFSSLDKFESGTGWPSFTRPLEKEHVIEKIDASHGMVRKEVRSLFADSHLGHVFNDGPLPTGLRYCINSASLYFIAKEDLEQAGYGQYLALFEK